MFTLGHRERGTIKSLGLKEVACREKKYSGRAVLLSWGGLCSPLSHFHEDKCLPCLLRAVDEVHGDWGRGKWRGEAGKSLRVTS